VIGRPVMMLTMDRLQARGVTTSRGCLEWTGKTNKAGYGIVSHAGRDLLVHRVMADLVGLPGTGPNVLHTCDNPPCFEPAHLFRGTQADNVADAVQKGRNSSGSANAQKTTCPRGHQYDRVAANGGRRCGTCLRAGQRERRRCAR